MAALSRLVLAVVVDILSAHDIHLQIPPALIVAGGMICNHLFDERFDRLDCISECIAPGFAAAGRQLRLTSARNRTVKISRMHRRGI